MKIPTLIEAKKLLNEAEKMNPGKWIIHSKLAAECASKIAEKCDDIDSETAYILALLHDIGRRFGVSDMKHVLDGYRFMGDMGYEDSARICLTHSFQYQHIDSFVGRQDVTKEEKNFLSEKLMEVEYDDYDRLVQLCDALAYPNGVTLIETRLVDVTLRRGINEYTTKKWTEIFKLKDYFDSKIGMDIYTLLGAKSIPYSLKGCI